ncbi:hypothetical protein ABES25_04020 [Bacillus gobiensis]|uniref:hypothetical protein n=1 Tax=Bacillus gobiensis TaxID=1441095 RepID=UPI003D200963
MIELTLVHYLFLSFIAAIILFMVFRKDTTFISLLGIFFIALAATHSFTSSISTIFNSLIYATTELLPTIFIICFIVSLSSLLTNTGINEMMVYPFTRIIKGPIMAYWVIGALMFIISSFFWPSPAVALIGAVLLPVAIKAGLPPISVAMAMNLFGHGFALSGDFVIQAAPKLTADAAGIPVHDVLSASIPLVIIMGVVTTFTAFLMIVRSRKNELVTGELYGFEKSNEDFLLAKKWRIVLASIIPIVFISDIIFMILLDMQGGEATALIGGTSIIILLLIHFVTYKHKNLEKITGYFIHGFQFGFKVFGPVIPIAAFFYLGDSAFETLIPGTLPDESTGIVNDLGIALAHVVPLTGEIAAVTLTAAGAVTGLDGSGFSGISLAGSIAKLFSSAVGADPAVLTALGQIAAIWVGGGTIIPWALIPAAAICRVDPFLLARKNMIPVLVGLVVTTTAAIFLL